MITNYKKFYKDLFQRTNGFLPIWPLERQVKLGDILLIRSGKMIPLGNINDPFFGLAQDIRLSPFLRPMDYLWQSQSGVRCSQQAYELGEAGGKGQRLLIEFDHPGDYFFRVDGIAYRSIENFYQFQFKLLQQLASGKFNFRELYIITTVAEVGSYAVGVALSEQASVTLNVFDHEMVTLDNLTQPDLSLRLESMQGIQQLRLAEIGGPLFFKAHKLEVSPKGKDRIRKYMRENLPDSLNEYLFNILTYTPSEILPSVEINPANVQEIFHFREVNLDDISRLFGE